MRSRPALDLLNLPEKALETLYGFQVSNDYRDYETKAKMIVFHEENYAIADSTGICKTPAAFFTPHLFAFKDYAKMVDGVFGLHFTEDEMKDVGRRIYATERLFNIREGMGRKDDYLPERHYEEPTPLGQEINRNKVIDRVKYDAMLDEYYDFHGWDREGRPLPETLKKIGLDGLDKWEFYS